MHETSATRFDRKLWQQGSNCYYCSKPMIINSNGRQTPDQATRDHYIAKSKGGKRIVAACLRCNNLKGDRDAKKFKRRLKKFSVTPKLTGTGMKTLKA